MPGRFRQGIRELIDELIKKECVDADLKHA